jgi:hypothetical protein
VGEKLTNKSSARKIRSETRITEGGEVSKTEIPWTNKKT